MRNEPARYMSWLRSASISIGPVVGRESTTDTTAAPDTTWGNRLPMSATKGLRAIRRGYLTSSRIRGIPFARAVTTYCLRSSSRRFARSLRIIPAVPDVPITTTGIHRCSSTETSFPQLMGCPRYSGSMRPPIDVPKCTLAR